MNHTNFCGEFLPCADNQNIEEYLNISAVVTNQQWLTSHGRSFVQMQRTCDAALLDSNFSTINMPAHLFLALFALIVSILSLVTNVGMILTINNDPEMKYVGGLLHTNLAVSDMIFGAVGGILVAYMQLELVVGLNNRSSTNFVDRVIFNLPLLYVQGYLLRVCTVVNMILMAILVFDLHKRISNPFGYAIYKQEKLPLMQKLCAVVWLTIAACYIYPMFGHWAYFAVSPLGPFVSTIKRCTASNGNDGLWFFRSVYIIGLLIVVATVTWIVMYARCCVKEWKGMSSVARRRQVARSKLTAVGFLFYTAPCLVHICGAMKNGEVNDPALTTFLVVFCLLRSWCMFFVHYHLQRQFEKSAKSLVAETIPRKFRQFRLQAGIGDF